jgi:hypothetical protein
MIEKPKYVPYHLRHFYASVLIANRVQQNGKRYSCVVARDEPLFSEPGEGEGG